MQGLADAIQHVTVIAHDPVFIIIIDDLIIDIRLLCQLIARHAYRLQILFQSQLDHTITFLQYIFYKIYTLLTIPLFEYILI